MNLEDPKKELWELSHDEIAVEFHWAIEIIQRYFSKGLGELAGKDSLDKRFRDFQKDADPVYSELMNAMEDVPLARTFVSYWKAGQTLAVQSRFWLEDAIAELILTQRSKFGRPVPEIYSQRSLSEGFPDQKMKIAFMGEEASEHMTGRKPWRVRIQKSILDATNTIVGGQETERSGRRIHAARQYDAPNDLEAQKRDKEQLVKISKSIGEPPFREMPLQCNLLVIEPLEGQSEDHVHAIRFVNRKTIGSHAQRRQERANLLRLYGFLVQEKVWRSPEKMTVCVAELLPRNNVYDWQDPYPDYFSSLTYWNHRKLWKYINVPFGAVTIALQEVAKHLRTELRAGLRGLLPDNKVDSQATLFPQ